MNKSKAGFIFTLVGLVISTVPPIMAILSYFPIWMERGASTVLSGFTLLLILMAIVPLFKLFKRLFESPSAPIMWLIAFIIFFTLSKISNEMTVISFVGFISNLTGSFFFKLSDKYRMKRTGENEG